MKSQSGTNQAVPLSEEDFIPLPARTFAYRGVNWSRSTLLRLRKQGRVKVARFRFSGTTKPRLFVLRESLDHFIAEQVVE